jgi:precorrin-3B methylase
MSNKKDALNASLVIVGSGIKFISHLTTEAKAYITGADKVLYLVNEPAMKEWIEKINPCSESLDKLYVKYPLRLHNYRAITNYILKNLRKNIHLCVVMYGHPAVFSQPALNAVIQAKKEDYYTKVLPAISAIDCLFADLLIDPGVRGCQLFDATDLLVSKRLIDPTAHLILWQAGVIGMLGLPKNHDNTKGATLLYTFLKKFYSPEHNVILYEAAQYPFFEPKIEKFSLKQLPFANFSRLSIFYILSTASNPKITDLQ